MLKRRTFFASTSSDRRLRPGGFPKWADAEETGPTGRWHAAVYEPRTAQGPHYRREKRRLLARYRHAGTLLSHEDADGTYSDDQTVQERRGADGHGRASGQNRLAMFGGKQRGKTFIGRNCSDFGWRHWEWYWNWRTIITCYDTKRQD